jgi:hypothetical protein
MATPSLAMIPSGYKASKVYSVLPESGVGDFDFTRATTATRVNSSGLIEEMAINVPRLEYPLIDGVVNGCPSLLLEPQTTNLITYSEDFTQGWTESNSIITSNQVISPDGTLNADKLTKSDINGSIIKVYTFVGGEVFSIFAKADESNILTIDNGDGRSYFDLINGTYNASTGGGYIEHYGNGWYRCTVENSYVGTSTIRVYPSDSLTSLSGTTGSLYIWGAMLEANSFSTSYIPTNGSAVTRNAETCNGAGDAATFNDSEGVLMVETSSFEYPITQNNWLTITDGSINNSIGIVFESTGSVVARNEVGGVNYSYLTHIIDYTNVLKIAFKYKLNDLQLWINGYKVSVLSNSPIFPNNTLNSLQLQYGGGSNTFYGNTKQIQYYNSALTDSELEQLTSWTSFSDMANGQQYSII